MNIFVSLSLCYQQVQCPQFLLGRQFQFSNWIVNLLAQLKYYSENRKVNEKQKPNEKQQKNKIYFCVNNDFTI